MKMSKRIRLGALLVAVLVIGMAFVATSSAPAVDSNISDLSINNLSINDSSINDSSNPQEVKLPDDQRATVATNVKYEPEIGESPMPQFREDAIVYFKEMPDIGAFASKYRGKVIFVKPDIKMAAFETNPIRKNGEVNRETLDFINEVAKDPRIEKIYRDEFMFIDTKRVHKLEPEIKYPEYLDKKGVEYVSNEVVVGFWRMPPSLNEFASKYSANLTDVEDVLLFAVFKTDNAAGFLKRISTEPYVRYAFPDIIGHTLSTPNDPAWNLQWGPMDIYAPEAWDYQKGSPTVAIAILDSGVDYNHEDLAGHVYQGYDFVNSDSDPMDDSSGSHGTHVAGIAGAIMNNSKGIAGIAQSNIFAVKVCNYAPVCRYWAAEGIRYAANNSAEVISMSFGWREERADVRDATDYAWGKGSLLVASSGNNGIQEIEYPGNYSTVIAVGAINSSDQRWIGSDYGSNYGDKLELVAPGVNIYSTLRNNSYDYETGTSMAVPYVSGVAALIWSQYPALSNNEVRQILTGTADDLGSSGRDIYYGYGKVNAYRAVSSYLSGWNYRKLKTITGSTAGAQTNYQMKLTVYNSAGTDTPGNIYLGGNAKSDFSDLRFTKSDGVTLLDYWIESYTPGVSAVVWVEVDSIPASPGTTNIYIYYGNPSASGISNGGNTFLFFDDFPGTSLDSNKWTVPPNNYYSVSNGKLQVLRQDANVASSIYSKQQTFGIWTAAAAKAQIPWGITSGSYNVDYFGYSSNGEWASNTVVIAGNGNGGCSAGLLNYINAWGKASISGDSNEHIWEIRRTNTASYAFKDNTQVAGPLSTQYSTVSGGINFQNQRYSGTDAYYVDWVFVRNYVSPEPAWGA